MSVWFLSFFGLTLGFIDLQFAHAVPFLIGSPLSLRGGYSDSQDQFNPDNFDMASSLDHEPFQDRVDAWKRNQLDHYSKPSSVNDLESPRDAEGRMKLLTSVSKGSRAIIFFLLLWRDVHLYEIADSTLKGMSRIIVVTPLCILFLANLAGLVACLTSPGNSAKKRMKAILNLDKLVESILIVYNFLRLTVWPTRYVPREVFIANILHSVFFLLQSQAFTRVTWDQITEQKAFNDEQMDDGYVQPSQGFDNDFNLNYDGNYEQGYDQQYRNDYQS